MVRDRHRQVDQAKVYVKKDAAPTDWKLGLSCKQAVRGCVSMTRSILILAFVLCFQIWHTGDAASEARLRPCRGLNDPVA
jgi:hypothetical protein